MTIRFSDHAPVLSHFDMAVARGEWVGIIGHSGAGKSSLADIVAGLETPAVGRVHALPLAYLTQKTVLFDDT